MPQRNAHNPSRKISIFDKDSGNDNATQDPHAKKAAIAGVCSSCNTEVPVKPGFRPSSLKCPKCGKALGKK